MSARCPLIPRADIPLRFAQQLRLLGDFDGDAPSFVLAQEFRRRLSPRFVLEIDVGQCLPVVIADDELGIGLVGGARRREAARH